MPITAERIRNPNFETVSKQVAELLAEMNRRDVPNPRTYEVTAAKILDGQLQISLAMFQRNFASQYNYFENCADEFVKVALEKLR